MVEWIDETCLDCCECSAQVDIGQIATIEYNQCLALYITAGVMV
jgi:hypothetical protein